MSKPIIVDNSNATSEASRHSTAELIAFLRERMARLVQFSKDMKFTHDTSSDLILGEAADRLAEQEAALEQQEWFFRWAARAMANGNHKEGIETIFNHPSNPYKNNNPWAEKALQPTTEAKCE